MPDEEEVKQPTPYEVAKSDAAALLTNVLYNDQGRAPSVKQQLSVNEIVDAITAAVLIQVNTEWSE